MKDAARQRRVDGPTVSPLPQGAFSLDFTSFARLHGVLIRDLRDDDKVHRVPTVGKPGKRNGSYQFDGRTGWIQDWQHHQEPVRYVPDATLAPAPMPRQIALDAISARDRTRREAAEEADQILRSAVLQKHPYLARKGFPEDTGLVATEGPYPGALVVPVRDARAYSRRVMSCQFILEDGTKKFLKGGQMEYGVFRLGAPQERAEHVWLCEGLATGKSLLAALLASYRRHSCVVVCFSAGNLPKVADLYDGSNVFVMADHDDPSKNPRGENPGALAAQAAGRPWTMPPRPSDDANDLHQREGLEALQEVVKALLRR